jgi:hypothetical protein
MIASKLLVHDAPVVEERPLGNVNGISAKRINGSRVTAIRRSDQERDSREKYSSCHRRRPAQ